MKASTQRSLGGRSEVRFTFVAPIAAAHAFTPTLAGDPQGRTQARAPMLMNVSRPTEHVRSPPNLASTQLQKLGKRK